ncbi:hypothetical protein F5Y06DRAFT_308506 [Hypoxylon sp. FL0890]|nr:hypothetical protein F5Y06DRAFT_308506 [Hypoxylon sp. FL0890]
MAESESSMSSTSSARTIPWGIIKVYATPDDSSDDWTRPQRIHLHEEISLNTTVCCESFTAGGIIEDQGGELFYLTSDKIVPRSSKKRERHIDTEDRECTCIGSIKHTSRSLHYALISINESVVDCTAIEYAKDMHVPVWSQLSYEAAMHPALIKYHHMKSDMAVLARTPDNEVFIGHIKKLPSKVVRPSFLGSGELMVAQFEPWTPRELEVGMWVYARRPGAISTNPRVNTMLKQLDHGPYSPEVFSYRRDIQHFDHGNPLVLIGHIVEIGGSGSGQDGKTEVTIQSAYEVLTEIFVQHGRLDHPDGAEPIPAGIDPMYFEMLRETAN